MPMRAFRASRDAFSTSTGHAGAHIAGNKIAWIIGCAGVAAVLFYLTAIAPGRGGTIWGDLGAVADRITELTGRRPRWWRPPFGARPILGGSRSRAGLRLVTWSWSAGDWVLGAGASDAVPSVQSGHIALLHDGAGKPSARARTLVALQELVYGAKTAGLAIGPLSDPA